MMMIKRFKLILVVLFTSISVNNNAIAQNLNEVVATADGIEISRGQVLVAKSLLAATLKQVPEEQRSQIALKYVIDSEILANAALLSGMEKSEELKIQLDLLQKRAIFDAYIDEAISKQITDEKILEVYQKEIGSKPLKEEVRARHVLLATKEEAKSVEEKAKNGEDFAELAKTYSTGPSGSSGGDLGYFTAERMVPEFSQAAFALNKGEISEPVQTQFGWHVIKLEDRRNIKPPSLEMARGQIVEYLNQSMRMEFIENLTKNVEIEILKTDF